MQITSEHPIYVEGEGWLLAENLELGDGLRRADRGMAKVLAIEQIRPDAPQPVYNFTVRRPHTYFVLNASILFHMNVDTLGTLASVGASGRMEPTQEKEIALALRRMVAQIACLRVI